MKKLFPLLVVMVSLLVSACHDDDNEETFSVQDVSGSYVLSDYIPDYGASEHYDVEEAFKLKPYRAISISTPVANNSTACKFRYKANNDNLGTWKDVTYSVAIEGNKIEFSNQTVWYFVTDKDNSLTIQSVSKGQLVLRGDGITYVFDRVDSLPEQ